MPRNSSGAYTAPAGTIAVTQKPISSAAYDTFINDISQEITNSLNVQGTAPMQAALSMGANRITGMADPVNPQDSVTLNYLLNTFTDPSLGVTTGSANAQLVTAPNFGAKNGQKIGFIAGFTNTGALTLNSTQVYKATVGGPSALSGGEVALNNFYVAEYSTNIGGGAFVLLNPTTNPIQTVTGLGTGVAAALQNAVNSGGGLLTAQSPQSTTLTSGSGTYTPPAGALYLEVEMVGGGSGGAGGGTGGAASAAAGNTIFGGMTAAGGAAAPAPGSSAFASAASATGGNLNVPGGVGTAGINFTASSLSGFCAAGGNGAASSYGPGGPGGILYNATSTFPAAAAAYGAGGGGGSGNAGNQSGFGGNSGATVKATLTTPSSSYSYAVGNGTSGGAAGTGGNPGASGMGGMIKITAKFQ